MSVRPPAGANWAKAQAAQLVGIDGAAKQQQAQREARAGQVAERCRGLWRAHDPYADGHQGQGVPPLHLHGALHGGDPGRVEPAQRVRGNGGHADRPCPGHGAQAHPDPAHRNPLEHAQSRQLAFAKPSFHTGCAVDCRTMPRGDLFPEIGPFETGYLPLSDGHVMYWEQVGNPRGRPVLFLHGGPGPAPGRCIAASSIRRTGGS